MAEPGRSHDRVAVHQYGDHNIDGGARDRGDERDDGGRAAVVECVAHGRTGGTRCRERAPARVTRPRPRTSRPALALADRDHAHSGQRQRHDAARHRNDEQRHVVEGPAQLEAKRPRSPAAASWLSSGRIVVCTGSARMPYGAMIATNANWYATTPPSTRLPITIAAASRIPMPPCWSTAHVESLAAGAARRRCDRCGDAV